MRLLRKASTLISDLLDNIRALPGLIANGNDPYRSYSVPERHPEKPSNS